MVFQEKVRPSVAFVGDSGSGGKAGAVPAPASGDAAANKFLKADGSWSLTPAASASWTTGTAILDFGAFPGLPEATLVITGQAAIASGSLVMAWVCPVDTADKTADEQAFEDIVIKAYKIVAGTGFTIIGYAGRSVLDAPFDGPPGGSIDIPAGNLLYGKFNVAWAWK
jgi:hypothetical protein